MQGRLEKRIQQLDNFVPYKNKKLREDLNKIAEQIKLINKNNIAALIPVGQVKEKEVFIGDYESIEDYEVKTFQYIDKNYERWDSKEQYASAKEKDAKELFKIDKVNKGVLEGYYNIVDGNNVIVEDYFDTKEEVEERLIELEEEWLSDRMEEFDNFDVEDDEIMWNWVWNFNGSVNEELAKRLGLGVLTFLKGEHDEDSFLFLQGCGMDFSPLLVAYQALEFGFIQEQFVSKLDTKSNRIYFKNVVGEQIYREVMQKLELVKFIDFDIETA